MKKGIIALITVFAILMLASPTHTFWPFGKRDDPLKNLRLDRIVLITLDTLRADHLSCYGYPRKTSPFIDSLARDGVLFKRMISSASLTSPTHASIFTSLYPVQHNVLKNGQRLDDSFLTMAELLSSAGYQTAGFVSTEMHFKAGNMDQGFEVFDEPEIKKHRRHRKRQIERTVNKNPDAKKQLKYRQADKTVNKTLEWLDAKQSDERFFLWVHLFDTHMPYRPPLKILEELQKQSEEEKKLLSEFLFNEYHIDYSGFKDEKEKNKIPELINRYDAEIMFIDKEIKRLYKHFQDRGLDSNTLWIITSDHGEGLGNHQYLHHGRFIYNEHVHVPLILYFTSGAVKGLVVEQVVEQVDILPTVAELTGAADLISQTMPVEGASLVPLLKEDFRSFAAKYAFSYKWGIINEDMPEFMKKRREAREAFWKEEIERRRPAGLEKEIHRRKRLTEAERKKFKTEKFALQDRKYKYIFNVNEEDEFYNLAEDPYEVNNLIGMGLKEEDRFRDTLMQKVKRLKKNASGKPESVDRETIERLKSLGYMQ